MGRGYMPVAQRTDWGTPSDLFDKLAEEYGPFDLDPCGSPLSYVSHRCGTYYTRGGLEKPWLGRVFVNPPYGRGLLEWVQKCHAEAHRPEVECVVALLPARTDTRWWQRYVMQSSNFLIATEVRFLPGRLKFVGASDPAPFPSVVVVWR